MAKPTKLFEQQKFLLTNTLTRKKEEFKPAKLPVVTFYSCGPTVYGPLHIGNARALIVADLLNRWLRFIGYDVQFVRNYTDVDDKIIQKSIEEKISADEVAQKYVDYCEVDLKNLELKAPDKTVRVTESIDQIIQLIQKIIDNGHAYVAQGEVLFSVRSFKNYGALSGKKVDELQAGVRIDVDPKKKDPMDFSLWKPAKPGEPFWESPWGKGRPGWHIECSAMVSEHLGDSIDLHHGGQDLIFPHHENEIAQSEAGTHKPFCKHWVHHAFLTAGNEKMSKSLGNILTIRDFTEKYGAEFLKFLYLGFQFRSAVPYTEETMLQSLNELERIYLAKKWALSVIAEPVDSAAQTYGDAYWKQVSDGVDNIWEMILEELFSDLNTPGALGHLFSLIREINRVEQKKSKSAERKESAQRFIDLLEKKLNPIFNVFMKDPDVVLKQIALARQNVKGTQASLSDEEIEKLIEQRAEARSNKDFKTADDIRKHCEANGIILVDQAGAKTTWKLK